MLATLTIAAIGAGSAWFGFAAILPLLYLLPCAAMIFFCRRGMSNSRTGEDVPCQTWTESRPVLRRAPSDDPIEPSR